jgi:peptidoglycan hydrolase-like protein with peptidoglycan-binding domain
MRNYTRPLAIVGLTATLAFGGCSVATYGPSSDAYATGEGGPAVPREPEAPVVLTSDADVRVVQQRLAQLNHYPGRPDGVWGSDVQASVESFQRSQGLTIAPLNEATLNTMGLDPVPLTRRRPIAATSGLAGMPVDAKAGPGEVWVGGLVDTGRVVPTAQGTPPARISSLSPRNLSAAGVSDVQEKLSGRGFYRAGVDGIWGPRSDQALRDFQGQNGLPADGQIDARTAGALGLDFERLSADARQGASGPGGLQRIGPSGTTTGTVGNTPPGTVAPAPVPGYQRQ